MQPHGQITVKKPTHWMLRRLSRTMFSGAKRFSMTSGALSAGIAGVLGRAYTPLSQARARHHQVG
eukprot:14378371-Alexandrium_andersonii.AAC.1